jgi:hypothetical protein
MDDETKNSVHLFDGETICCGIEVIDIIDSLHCDGGIAIVVQHENLHYATVRYVTMVDLCNCPECLAICNDVKQEEPQEIGIMAQALMRAGDGCSDNFS